MATIKKAQSGDRITSRQKKRLGRISEKNPERAKEVAERMKLRATRRKRGSELYDSLSPKEDLPAFKARTMAEAKSAKNGKSFPDLNKDGKITKADILKGRGVIKNGGKIKKAQAGLKASNKRVGPVDPKGAWTKVQEMNLPPRNVKTKASLTEDKQLGATKMAKEGKWIQKAIKKPGALRSSLGVKKGEKIPAGKLAAAAKKPGKMGQRARLAQTLKKMKK
jgi:hypothetical protein